MSILGSDEGPSLPGRQAERRLGVIMHALKTAALSVLAVLLAASAAISDGGFISRADRDVREPEQVAVIHFGDGVETLLLRVKYHGAMDYFAWVVPVPSLPDVEAIPWDTPEHSLLMELSSYTGDREGQRAQRHRRGGIARTTLDVEAPPSLGASVEVLERKQAGVYDVAVLKAGDAAPLVEWLRSNGFVFPTDRADVLDHYVSAGWAFVAMRIAPGELASETQTSLVSGEIQPILLRFRSDKMLYPLRMSSINPGETRVLIYTLGASPMVPSDGPRASEIPLSHTLCSYGQLGTGCTDPATGAYTAVGADELRKTREILALGGESLSVGRYSLTYASDDMTGDLTFATFNPLAHWRAVRDTARSPEQRAMAGWVLSWHDPALLGELAASQTAEERCAAAYSPKAKAGILQRLAVDQAPDVRWMVAANPSAPQKLLLSLASNDSVLVRQAVARNPSAPIDAVRLLAVDESAGVRWVVGCHPSMTEGIWRLWSRSADPAVRRAAAGHGCTPAVIIEELAGDEDARVRERVAIRDDLSQEVKSRLARDADASVRRSIALRCTIGDESTLALLAVDVDAGVREAVALNGHVPPTLLEALAADPNPGVRRVAVHKLHPHGSVLGRPAPIPDLVRPGGTLVELAPDPSERVRAAVARNRHTPPTVLVSLASDPVARVRRMVALNPATPDDTLWELAQDADSAVREAAFLTLQTPR